MDTRPKDIKELFEYLNKKDINEKTIEKKAAKWSRKDIIDLYDEVFEKTPYIRATEFYGSKLGAENSFDPFDFNVSPMLSGGRSPCAGFECRMIPADELARFSAIYAEHALILNPIYDMREKFRNNRDDDSFWRMLLVSDFKIFYYYQPLLEERIIELKPHAYNLCKECADEAIKGIKKIERAVIKIAKDNVGKFHFHYHESETDSVSTLTIEGPEEFVGPHDRYRMYTTGRSSGMNDAYLVKDLILDGVSGLMHPYWNNYSYITNYMPEIEVLRYTTEKKFPKINKSSLKDFSHNLPFIYDVPLSKLITLRKKEGESFKVYRDSIRLAMKLVENNAENKASDIYHDVILPELNNIDNTIKNSRKMLTRSLSEELLIGAGLIGLGAYAGLVSPTFGACLGALGGFNFASGLVKQASHVLSEPSDIRDSSYYFLWKVRKESKKQDTKKRP